MVDDKQHIVATAAAGLNFSSGWWRAAMVGEWRAASGDGWRVAGGGWWFGPTAAASNMAVSSELPNF